VIDFLSAETFANGHPHDLYGWLRQNDPVHWHDEPGRSGFWAIMRHADARYVNVHHDLFSHAPSSQLEDDGEVMIGRSMVNQDPPRQTRVRTVTVPEFLPGAVREGMGRMRHLAAQLIDEVIERGECDLVVDVAGEMAGYVMADLLQIPLEDCRVFYHHLEIALAGPDVHPMEEIIAAMRVIDDYGRGLLVERRANPGTDILSRLATEQIDGELLSDDDWNANFSLLVAGAGDTTRHLIGGGLFALFENPDQREILADDLRGVMPTAVEEMLRWVTPVVYNRRMAIADCEVGGQAIKAGDKVACYYGSANRDESVFQDPFRFDVRRTPNQHMAFSGVGAHFCLGAHIARAEATAVLEQIFERMPDVAQAGPESYDRSNFVSGLEHLPASFTPGPRTVS
jgi:cytochrome P450